MNYYDVLIGAVGGAMAVSAAFLLWCGKFIEEMEKRKAKYANDNAVATARVEYLRALWTATFDYGGAVAMLVSQTYEPAQAEEIKRRFDAFDKAMSSAGVFIGYGPVEKQLQLIGEPFQKKLEDAIEDIEETKRLMAEFQNKLWLQALEDIQTLLHSPKNPE